MFVRKNANQRYCSYRCSAQAQLNKERKHPKRSEAACVFCGQKFIPNGPLAKYCSQKCYDAARWRRRCPNIRKPSQRLQAQCQQCQKEFYRLAKEYKKRIPCFCSPECGYAYRRGIRGNPPKPETSRYWQTTRKAALERDHGICCACGSADLNSLKLKRKPAIDHIIPRRLMERWGLEVDALVNLACLCLICHGKKTEAEWKLFKGDILGFVTALARMNYPRDRVADAMVLAGLPASLVEQVYGSAKKVPRGEYDKLVFPKRTA
jgi:hypothetical protein